jgi:S-adenosylmethionine:tRNA ribosyltransferase-isomerase
MKNLAGFPNINLEDYTYDLPKEKIAQFPLERRDKSKLLHFKDQKISHYNFTDVAKLIPVGSTLFFNDTRVIPARITFQRNTGALIEVFLLDPIEPSNEVAEAMLARGECIWKCMIGNLKKWKDDEALEHTIKINDEKISIRANLQSRSSMHVQLSWCNTQYSFSEILSELGKVPLPPYVTRAVEESDSERYQTIYSKMEGAVAAPTAGLHFTPKVLNDLESKGITQDYLTLHVSSGTFQPIKSHDISKHPMHSEQVVVKKGNIEAMLKSNFCIAVGTTSLRTMESIYWYGVKLENHEKADFHIEKDAPYNYPRHIPLEKSLQNVRTYMERSGTEEIHGITEIFIVPGYQFQTCEALVTNFHMPGSTLMLLVGAFIGADWKSVYNEALESKYRFLSYGDSSLLFRKD